MVDNKLPSYVLNCKWDSQQKIDSRTVAIIELYRQLFNMEFIPDDKQYWTMCGAHFNRSGRLKGEYGHLYDTGLIRPQQFYGVDREQIIINENRRLYPQVRWLQGDFLEVMEKYLFKEKFNPAIINYDGVLQPKNSCRYLKAILKFVDNNISKRLLLIANFVLTNPYTREEKYRFTIQQALDQLKSIYWFPKHWKIVPQAYTYESASRNNDCIMGMIMFVKQQHDLGRIRW